MITAAQRIAFRNFVAASLGDAPDGSGELEGIAVAWSGQDHPRPDDSATIDLVAVEFVGPPEDVYRAEGDPAAVILARYTVTPIEVTASITVRMLRDDAAPTWGTDAGVALRRLVNRVESDDYVEDLTAAGIGIVRVGALRDLSSLARNAAGGQWQSVAVVDLVLSTSIVERTTPEWIERIAGSIEITDAGTSEFAAADTDPHYAGASFGLGLGVVENA
jgi:hypothetical protein